MRTMSKAYANLTSGHCGGREALLDWLLIASKGDALQTHGKTKSHYDGSQMPYFVQVSAVLEKWKITLKLVMRSGYSMNSKELQQ